MWQWSWQWQWQWQRTLPTAVLVKYRFAIELLRLTSRFATYVIVIGVVRLVICLIISLLLLLLCVVVMSSCMEVILQVLLSHNRNSYLLVIYMFVSRNERGFVYVFLIVSNEGHRCPIMARSHPLLCLRFVLEHSDSITHLDGCYEVSMLMLWYFMLFQL